MRMNAYYYGFTPTQADLIDRILSAVACAGKAYHDTENWTTRLRRYEEIFRGETCVEWIQNAANDAARALAEKDAALAVVSVQRDERIELLRERITELEDQARDLGRVDDLLHDSLARGAALEADLAAMLGALEPFASGGEWAIWKAFLTHGPATKEEGIRAAKQITAWQVIVDAALRLDPARLAPKKGAMK